MEAIPTRQATSKVIIDFLVNNIITRFGVPVRLIMDNANSFRSEEFTNFCISYGICISYASLYYPYGNKKVESSNKSLMKIIKRTLEKNKKAWDAKMKMVVWADRIIVKKDIKKSLFELVYGTQVRLPVKNHFPVYRFIHENELEVPSPMSEIMAQLIKLDEVKSESHGKKLKL